MTVSSRAASDDVPWLTAEELHDWFSLSALAERLPAVLDAQLQREAGLSMFEYVVLAHLSESPDRARRMSQLAMLANGSLSRLSHGVARLEARGWVERRPCADDGRATEAVLTEAGWEKVVATAPVHVREVRRLVLDPLTAQQRAALGVAARAVLTATDPAAASWLAEGLPGRA